LVFCYGFNILRKKGGEIFMTLPVMVLINLVIVIALGLVARLYKRPA
jgi:hypothetical protein